MIRLRLKIYDDAYLYLANYIKTKASAIILRQLDKLWRQR